MSTYMLPATYTSVTQVEKALVKLAGLGIEAHPSLSLRPGQQGITINGTLAEHEHAVSLLGIEARG